MPQDVTKEIKVAEIRKGDKLIATDGVPFAQRTTVVDVTRKQTYAYIAREGHDKPLRIRFETSVTVTRSEATLEEKAASMHEYMVDALRKNLRDALNNNPAKMMSEIVTKFNANEYTGELLTWSNLPDVLRAQAMYKQALILRHLVHAAGNWLQIATDVNVAEDALKVDPEVLLEAFAQWYYDNVDRTRSYGARDPLSRSTSAISNMLEDLDIWAKDKVLEDLQWTGAIEELKRRVAIKKEEHDKKLG